MDLKAASGELSLGRTTTSVGIVITALLGLLYFAYRWALPKPLPNIPYDERDAKSLFGSIPQIIAAVKQTGRALPWLTSRNAHHNAPLVQIWTVPFSKPVLVLCDFQESQDVLMRRTKEFDRASRTMEGFEGLIPHHHISMRATDPRFKGNKELVRDLMSPQFLNEASAPQIYAKTMALIDLWSYKAKAADGKPFEARQDINGAAMDIVNAAAFALGDDLSLTKSQVDHLVTTNAKPYSDSRGGADFDRLPMGREMAAIRAVTDYVGEQVNAPLPRWAHRYRMLTDPKLRSDIATKDEVIRNQIKRSLERLEDGNAVQLSATDYIVQREHSVAKRENRTPDFYSSRTMHELFGYVIAGHETTSSALSWTLKLIGDNPASQDRLREELRAAHPAAISEGRQPTAKEIASTNIPYLDAYMEECLRLGAPTPMVAREAVTDTVLLGHRIPKGTNIYINSAGPGYFGRGYPIDSSTRSETSKTKYWGGEWNPDDTHLFKPERWLKIDQKGDAVYDSQAGPFLSFSLGARGCFGRRLAYLEMRMVITLLVWNFHFKQLDGPLVSYTAGESITVYPKFCYVALDRL